MFLVKKMKISSEGIVNGKILDKYGKRGREKRFGMPTLSLPIKIEDFPKETKSFVVVFDDPDSVPVCNFVWIHWLVANLHRTTLEENASETCFDFIQGKNSWHDNSYGGPCPPDRPHKYRLTVYAMNDDLNLRGDFSKELLDQKMQGKILESTTIYGIYEN